MLVLVFTTEKQILMPKSDFYWDLMSEGYGLISSMLYCHYGVADTSQNQDHYQE